MPSAIRLIRAASLMGYAALVEDLGGKANDLLRDFGLAVDDLDAPDAMIDFEAFEGILEHSAKVLACPQFGMRLAEKQDLSMLGSIGLMMARCATVKEALDCARHYMSLHVHAEYWTVEIDTQQTIVTRFQHRYQHDAVGQGRELSLAVCYRLLKQLIGPDFYCKAVLFSHRNISSVGVYRKVFDAPVSFNQEGDQLVFPSRFLARPLAAFDTAMQDHMQVQLDAQIALYEGNIERQVRSLILQTLGSQEHTIVNIAQLMSMHPRTLQRRLQAQGLSFKALLQEIRLDAASWLLSASGMDITFMSQMLGYSDISAFSKAFRLAKGCSPRAWRTASQGA